MTSDTPLLGGDLNAAVTEALVGIHTEHLGRGPGRALTFHRDNVVVTLMHDVLSVAEKILAQTGKHRDVSAVRELFQQDMEADLRAAVEQLTGRAVIAFLIASHLDPDVTAALFILDTPL